MINKRLIAVTILLLLLVGVVSAAVNYIEYSQEINNTAKWTITGANIPAGLINTGLAPDGTYTADAMNETTSGSKYLYQPTTTTSVSGTNYTVSCFIKVPSGALNRTMQLTYPAAGFPADYVNFNTSTGTIVKREGVFNASMEHYGNLWYRISITSRSDANGGSISPTIAFTNGDSATRIPSYTGANARSMYVWGVQSEIGDTLTAYNATDVPTPPTGDPTTSAFSASRTTGGTIAPITFTDASTESPTTWYWEFGDGNTSTVQNPTNIYSSSGTYSVNLWTNNTIGGDWENKTNYITIGTRPDSYLNPYSVMIPWLDQGNNGWCTGYAVSNAMMLLRYAALAITPGATEEPFTRDVWFNWSTYTVQSDIHVNYTPSMASIYWPYDTLSPTHNNITALAEVMKTGYNLQVDKITAKYVDTEYNHPRNLTYLNSHRYNPISNYIITPDGHTEAQWELLKQNISDNGVVVLNMDVYSNTETGMDGINLKNPTGSPTGGHCMAAIGYNNSLDVVYVLQSWGDDRFGHTWVKVMGLTKTYYTYSSATRGAFITPYNITINEVLPPPDTYLPVSSFTVNITEGIAPLSVMLNDTSTDTPYAWAYARNNLTHTTWELIASTRNATVSFTAGNWSVNHTATNDYGTAISEQVTWVNVSRVIPVSAFSANATIGTTYGMTVQFTDLSTGSPNSWYWEFGDGGTTTARNPVYIYDVARTYNVSLKVTNAYAEYDWENKTDYINLETDLPNVKSWLHFNGANGGTTFIDEMGNAFSVNAATTSSAQIKFGNASGLFNAAGSYISTPDSAQVTLGGSPFTLEAWVYPTSTGTNYVLFSKANNFLNRGWGVYHGSGAGSADWHFFMGDSATNSTSAFTLPLNTWSHLAIQRHANYTTGVYVDGAWVTSSSFPGSYATADPLRIGIPRVPGTGAVSFRGYIDEFRMSNAVRWQTDFTPPTEAYRDGQLEPDTNPSSTFRFKTDTPAIAIIANQTDGGVRNRTIQIQNVNAVSYIMGSMTFDDQHLQVKNVYLNKSTWTDAVLVSSIIHNDHGLLEYNLSRAGGFSPGVSRASFLDVEMLYWNYTQDQTTSSSFFGYGNVMNLTTGTTYPIHNFIETVLTYGGWDFYPDFTADVVTGDAPLTVHFTDTTIGYPNRWDWDYGDGEHTNWTTQNPTHIYTVPGLYNVTLTGTIWQNTSVVNSTTKIAYINVTSPPAPVASFTYTPQYGVEPLSVQFTDNSTNTPTGWGWFFTNVTPGNNTIIQFSTLQNPLKIFGFGNYTIKLNATSAYGSNVSAQTSWVNVSVYVPPLVPPVATFSADDTSICRNATVTFTDLSTNTPLSWYWEFGEGNTSILQNPTREYFNIGSYTVNLRATNADGFDWENKTNYITVNDCTPVTQCIDAAGNIPVALSGSTYSSLNWTWEADDVTKVSLDGVFLNADIDNSSPFLNTQGFDGDTWHMFKIYNTTDYGRLNCKTNTSAVTGYEGGYVETPISPILPIIAIIGLIFFIRKNRDRFM